MAWSQSRRCATTACCPPPAASYWSASSEPKRRRPNSPAPPRSAATTGSASCSRPAPSSGASELEAERSARRLPLEGRSEPEPEGHSRLAARVDRVALRSPDIARRFVEAVGLHLSGTAPEGDRAPALSPSAALAEAGQRPPDAPSSCRDSDSETGELGLSHLGDDVAGSARRAEDDDAERPGLSVDDEDLAASRRLEEVGEGIGLGTAADAVRHVGLGPERDHRAGVLLCRTADRHA